MPKLTSRGSSAPASPFQVHTARWEGCTACPLCEGRSKVVLARGRLPCDVLFVGEAPGESEDALGVPFIGPAGKLLDRIVSEALDAVPVCPVCRSHKSVIDLAGEWACRRHPGHDLVELRTAFTNLVACVPRDEDGGKTAEPPPEAVEACAPRLEEFVALAKPRLIVCVGHLARNWIMGTPVKGKRYLLLDYGGPLVEIIHPAAILRANVANRDLAVQRAVIALRDAAEEL